MFVFYQTYAHPQYSYLSLQMVAEYFRIFQAHQQYRTFSSIDSQPLKPLKPALITYRHPFLRSDKSGDLQETAHDQSYDQALD